MQNNFMEKLEKRAQGVAQGARPTIVFPESNEDKILKVVAMAVEKKIARPILLGNEEAILAQAKALDVSLDGVKLVDPTDRTRCAEYALAFSKERPIFSERMALKLLKDPLNFSAMMVHLGDADSFFAGLTYTTGEVILAAQTIIGLQEGISTVSSIGIMDVPGFNGPEGNLIAIGDCAVCADPKAGELADIAITSAETARSLLCSEPRVAMLSFSTKGSSEHPIVEKVREAVKIANERRPDLKIDGEFQLDAAIIPEVAAKKVKVPSEVVGRANVIIFPDLNAGNMGVKLVQRFAKAFAYGPTLQGFAIPVSDSSRGAPLEEILGGITMLAVRVIEHKKRLES